MGVVNVNDLIIEKECTYEEEQHDDYYPCCPKEIGNNPIESYYQILKIGMVLAYKDDAPKLIIHKFSLIKNDTSILVMCEREGLMCERDGYHPWSIYEIIFVNGIFVHKKIEKFFEKYDAENLFFISQGNK